ncbi:translesion error-prone DNA polymerase V autoproteolytic subunit [Marinicellulosiphila megalodicopiae]|uniref:translesion error-prone DNA polymerase V autoproteolytic subunit n=1 Tax=Marinicellulosiphila megalodicopiae TaxID=2724896 RepID=UPI003BAE9404
MSVWVLGRADSSLPALKLPMFLERISAGFPSPAQDYIEQRLDLNELCIEHPASTYFVRVQGDSMIEAGIYTGDILVVDRSLTALHNQIVIAGFEGELTVKQLCLKPVLKLMPRNKKYSPIVIPQGADLEIFGVVTNVLRNLVKQ